MFSAYVADGRQKDDVERKVNATIALTLSEGFFRSENEIKVTVGPSILPVNVPRNNVLDSSAADVAMPGSEDDPNRRSEIMRAVAMRKARSFGLEIKVGFLLFVFPRFSPPPGRVWSRIVTPHGQVLCTRRLHEGLVWTVER